MRSQIPWLLQLRHHSRELSAHNRSLGDRHGCCLIWLSDWDNDSNSENDEGGEIEIPTDEAKFDAVSIHIL